ncbi:hypothetical protein CPB83DRAFT_821238 [Crepidotus variabilis]|uniref:Uncharacterized protein n=1 Tax=Crepidotus variabilis TaxID=179855 RepID=A0A9P6E716_9AGAR|nr:hypothetical protein CPB83DRAFT_821238 [Crepidotus variabilis]
MPIIHRLLSFCLLTHAVIRGTNASEWAFSTLATIPLALRSPYLNIWTGSSTTPQWPTLWNKTVCGASWPGLVRVDGISYWWQGTERRSDLAQIVPGSIQMSPTRTRFQTVAGPVQLNITFLSPIEPTDWVKQSFPFSYFAIDVSSRDGQKHDIQLYSQISGELLAVDYAQEVTFNTVLTSQSIFHSLRKIEPSHFDKAAETSEDGTLYLGALNQHEISWQSGNCGVALDEFAANGTLLNEQDPNNTRKIIDDNSWVCLSLAYNFGSISSTSSPVVWALGLVREPSIRTVTAKGTELRSSYFWTKYPKIDLAIDDFLADYEEASKRAQTLDMKIVGDGNDISQSYADLLAFSARPVFGAIHITVARTSPTTLDSSDVKVYMKDVGNSSRSNAVDVLFSAFPAFLYLDVKLAGLLLEPLLAFQSSSQYHNNYSASGLGKCFQPLLPRYLISIDCSLRHCFSFCLYSVWSMLIMTLAHARKSGDGTLCKRYYSLLKIWADYLGANALDNDSLSGPRSSLTEFIVDFAIIF